MSGLKTWKQKMKKIKRTIYDLSDLIELQNDFPNVIDYFNDIEYNRDSDNLVFKDDGEIPDAVYWVHASEYLFSNYNVDVRDNVGIIGKFVKRHYLLNLPKRKEKKVVELTEWEETVLNVAEQLLKEKGYFRICEILERLSYSFSRLENKEHKIGSLLRKHSYTRKTKKIDSVSTKVWVLDDK